MKQASLATRKRLPAAERRQLIMSAAGEAFGARGYDGVTLDAIAAAAGVTKPILYRHFASKDELYLALLDRHRDEMPSFLAGVPEGLPLVELTAAILDGWFAYAERRAYSWRMIFRDGGGGEDIRASRERMYTDARAVLIGFLELHPAFDVAAADLETTAEVIRGGLSALVLYGQEHPGATRRSLVEAGTRMIVGLASEAG